MILPFQPTHNLLEKQAERTVAAIAHYPKAVYFREQEVQSLEDLTYWLLDKTSWAETISTYEDLSVLMLRLLNHP